MMMTTVTISLPESLRKFVEKQVQTKGYGNVSEYFKLLLEALDSGGHDIEVTPEFWKELKTEAAELIKKRWKRA